MPKTPPAVAALRDNVTTLLLFVILASVLGYARLTNPAFGAQSDLPFHYHFTRAYQQSLAEGDWLPQWAGLLDGGRGEALFTFYPPLCFFLIAGLARLFQTDLLNGLKLTTFTCLVLAQVGAYLFARAFFDRRLSRLAALAFVCLPGYSLITLNRALLPNGLALCLVPLVLLAAHHLLLPQETQRRLSPWVALFALSLSAIVLTHVVTTYVCALALGVMTLCYLPVAGWRGVRNVFLAGLVALALTAFFLLPQQLEINWVNVKVLTEQHDYRSYFLFAPPRSDNAYHQAWAKLNEAASWITLLQTALTLLAGLLLWRKPLPQAQRLLLRFSLALMAFSLFISLSLSQPVWQWLPGLSFLQFPWRMQPLVALGGGALLVLLGAHAWELEAERRKSMLLFPALLLLANLFLTYATARAPKQELSHTQVLQILDAHNLPPVTTEALREAQTKEGSEYLTFLGNQISYRPRGAETQLYSTAANYGGLTLISGRGEIRSQQLANQSRTFQLQNAEPVRVRLETYAYPHWIARLDGQGTPIQVEPGSGLMLLDVPAGEHTLTFSYERHQPLIIWAQRISALAWVLFAVWVGWLGYTYFNESMRAQAVSASV